MELAYIVYTAIFIVTILFAYFGIKANRGRKDSVSRQTWVFWGIAIVFYIFILGLRKDVGIDYRTYKMFFENDFNSSSGVDIIYYLFENIVKNGHYNYFIAFLAFIPIYFIFLSFKDKPKFLVLFLFFYFTWGTFFYSMNIMRQTAACAILLYVITRYLDRDYKGFIIFYILAFILHRSVLLALPFIFLFKFDFIKPRWIIICLLFLSFLYGQYIYNSYSHSLENVVLTGIFERYNYYLEGRYEYSERVTTGSGLFEVLNLFVALLVVFYSNVLKRKYEQYNFNLYYNFMIVGYIFHNIIYDLVMLRVFNYFNFLGILALAMLFHYLFFIQKNIMLKFIGVGLMLIGIVNYYYQIYKCTMEIAPFYFIF
ncbi:MAG: EpsG family protein [Prevotella sp.]|jgi:hypothetical protein|nr:EpsG family protein [Prevotella sp.]